MRNPRVTFSVPPPRAELVPILFLDLDTVELSGLFDICKGEVTVFGRNAFDLIETRQGIPYVSGVSQRLFALTRKGKHALRQIRLSRQSAVHCMGRPGWFCGHFFDTFDRIWRSMLTPVSDNRNLLLY